MDASGISNGQDNAREPGLYERKYDVRKLRYVAGVCVCGGCRKRVQCEVIADPHRPKSLGERTETFVNHVVTQAVASRQLD